MVNERTKQPRLAIAVMIVATVLLATAALTITTIDNAFAYSKNQATTGTNACGNGLVPTNVGCQNVDSQIQGDENSVALTAQQTFPSVVREVPTEPPTEPQTCLECFTRFLTEDQIAIVESFIGGPDQTVEALCEFWEANPELVPAELTVLEDILSSPPPGGDPTDPPVADEFTVAQLIDCLERVLGV
jgi:hypothetical protein